MLSIGVSFSELFLIGLFFGAGWFSITTVGNVLLSIITGLIYRDQI